MRRSAGLLAVVLAVLALPACSGGRGDDRYVLTVNGVVQVSGASGDRRFEDGRHKVHLGDSVEVTSGSAVLALPGAGAVELRAGRTIHAAQAGVSRTPTPASDSRLRVRKVPELIAGDALVMTGGDDVRLVAGSASMEVQGGAARVRRSAGVTLAVYRGKATVDALGRTLDRAVTAYRQVAVADTGALPRRAVPLVYDRTRPDPWDVRYLGDAIDLGTQLERRSLALNREVTSTVTGSLLATLLPSLRTTRFDGSLVDDTRSVGESVVGASIALNGPGDFTRRWNAAFDFRADGADWGLVALDQRARRTGLFGTLDGVLDRLPGRFATGGIASPATTNPTTTTSTTTRPGGGSTTSTTSPLPTTPTTVPRPPDPIGGLLDPILGQSSPPSGEPSSPTDPIDGLLDPIGGLLGVQPSALLGT